MSSPESTNGDLQVATVGSVPLGLEHTCCFTRELARTPVVFAWEDSVQWDLPAIEGGTAREQP